MWWQSESLLHPAVTTLHRVARLPSGPSVLRVRVTAPTLYTYELGPQAQPHVYGLTATTGRKSQLYGARRAVWRLAEHGTVPATRLTVTLTEFNVRHTAVVSTTVLREPIAAHLQKRRLYVDTAESGASRLKNRYSRKKG